MKRIVAIALIAIIALTVVSTAGVMAAPKKPTDTKITPISLKYEPGKTYTFLPDRYNVHNTTFLAPRDPTPPSSQHTEYANGATAYTSISQEIGQAGASYAFVGMKYKLNSITASDLSDPSKTCTVTYKVSYVLSANGDTAYAEIAHVYPSTGFTESINDVTGRFGLETKTMPTTTVTTIVPLNQIFTQDTSNNQIYGSQLIVAFSGDVVHASTTPTQSTASVIVDSIALTFDN